MGVCFGLGKTYDDIKQFDKAFQYYARANALRRKTFEYNNAYQRQRLGAMKASMTPALIDAKKDLGMTGWRPIFVVGMPRSGTTLIESILAAHSQLHGVGELNDLSQILSPDYEQYRRLDVLDETILNDLAREYQRRTEQYTNGLRPIDKMPGNFWRIGMIKLLYPDAIILHCCRYPLDTCVSIFKYNFPGAHYAFSQEEIGIYYSVYRDVMAYGITCFQVRFMMCSMRMWSLISWRSHSGL